MGQILGRKNVTQILDENDKGGFTLRSKKLEKIFLADEVTNKPVIVISVAGAFLSGKSFILDMILRYLRASDWLGDKAQGFMSLRPGIRRHTTGLLMWSEPIPVTLPSGEEAVIVLLDTQGTTDDPSTAHREKAVLLLSALLSSVFVFNVKDDVHDDNLEQLQELVEYGQLASDGPFQKLLFLVRDWSENDGFPFGAEGGDRLVMSRLRNRGGSRELENVRNHIGDCFSDIDGFLLPHPGQQVAESPTFEGGDKDMDPTFAAKVKELMPKILSPETLAVKTIAGNDVRVRDLLTLLTCYVDLFSSDELPKPEAIVQATTDASLKTAVQAAKTHYMEEMKRFLQEDQPSLDQDELLTRHKEAATKAEKVYNDRRKMGDEKKSQDHLKTLVEEIDEWFECATKANGDKRERERLQAEEKKRKQDEDFITELIDTCTKLYTGEMERVVGNDGFLPRASINSAHNAAKDKAMTKFDVKVKSHSVRWDSRFHLARVIGAQFRLILQHNDTKKTAENEQAARANLKAVRLAHTCYRTVIKEMTLDSELTEEELLRRHQQALQAATSTFEQLKEGTQQITAAYLDNLKKLIDEDLQAKKYTLPMTS